jgi:hypothetical protein
MKKIIPLLFVISNLQFPKAQKIYGVITYFFNQYQGDKADIGAKITVIDSEKVDETFLKNLNDDRFSYMLREVTHGPKAKLKKFSSDQMYDINRFHLMQYIIDDTGYAIFDSTVFYNFRKLIRENKDNSLTVDGSGNYSIPVKPGAYCIFIQSNGRRSYPLINVNGDFDYVFITVKNKDVSINHKSNN